MRSICRVLLKNVFSVRLKTVNLHVRVTKVVSEQVPRRWSSDSEGATAVRIELKPWNNEKTAAGGTKMYATDRRQTASSINAPWAGHNNNKLCAWRHNMPPPAVRRSLRPSCSPSLTPAAQARVASNSCGLHEY